VWYLAGSLFNRQPFAPPTEQFPFPVFRQAFTAVQSSVVHLQGVNLGCAAAPCVCPARLRALLACPGDA
jgi:hypothetical protein